MLTIGRLARRTGVRASAIRYYESQGVLSKPLRLPNGYRIYREDAVAAVRFVRSAQALGFTLAEVKQLLELARQGQAPCGCVQALARDHLLALEGKLRELLLLRRRLQALVRDTPSPPQTGVICPMIERRDQGSHSGWL
jgi:DNA-binding transcriptional MerR regulator